MCHPAAIAATALAVNIGGRIAENRAQADQARETRKAAARARRLEIREIGFRQQEEGQAASKAREDISEQASELAGTAVASFAGRNVGGQVQEMILGEIEASEGRAYQDVQDQYVVSIDQLEREKDAAIVREQARANSAPEPSNLATAIGIGGDLTNAYTNYRRLTQGE